MSDNIQDKQFIALELTKILFNEKKIYEPKYVYETYTYFLSALTETIDNIETITSLKNELDRLQKENIRLKENNLDIFRPFCEDLMAVLTAAQGDMEPYVYGSLVNIIKAKIQ